MKITLRGVRGSIPVPGPDTVIYGGNTTCHQINTDSGELIIIDGGSGIRELGNQLIQSKKPIICSIFITHTHWDHIQGLPFFLPLFIKGNVINIYGCFDPVYMKDLKTVLSQQMEYCYFPVRECELNAQINYINLTEGQQIKVGDAKVTPILTNHPVLNYGYKVEENGKIFFFSGDFESPSNIYQASDAEFAEYQNLIDKQQQIFIDFIKGADIFIADSQYTEQEYSMKKGWGHNTFEKNIGLAQAAKVKRCFFTHHDPCRTDTQLETIFESLKTKLDAVNTTEFALAKEGLVIDL